MHARTAQLVLVLCLAGECNLASVDPVSGTGVCSRSKFLVRNGEVRKVRGEVLRAQAETLEGRIGVIQVSPAFFRLPRHPML